MPHPRSATGLLFVALVFAPTIGLAQTNIGPCLTNANSNATAVLSSSISATVGPSDESLEGGTSPDSIAVLTPDGDCVGITAWNESGTSLPVAGNGSQVSTGIETGELLRFRLYDASRDVIDQAIVEYTDCSSVSDDLQSLCEDDGRYTTDAIYVIDKVGSATASLQVDGSSGGDGADAGWRFVGVPTASTLPAGDLRLGGEAPNFNLPEGDMLLEWNDEAASASGPTGTYESVSSTDNLQPGRGYALFLFDESPYSIDPSIQIRAAGNPPLHSSDSVTVDQLAQTARWHLLANPYPSGYDLSNFSDLAANGFQSTVQRYDANTGSWVAKDQSNTELAAWQAFFVERTDYSGSQGATELTFDPQGQIVGAPFVGSKSSGTAPRQHASIDLALYVTGAAGDTLSRDLAARVVFDDDATTEWDSDDASKLTPLRSEYALLSLRGQSRADSLTSKAVESRSWPSTLQSIPARLQVEELTGETGIVAVEDWTLPHGWNAQIVDERTGTTRVLEPDTHYSFDFGGSESADTTRFRVEIAPSGAELPVELTGFEATLAEEAARLEWQTASETNNAGFYVDRQVVRDTSSRSETWSEIGFVDGSGTTQKTKTYRFEDTDLPFVAEQFVYRLRQVDTDGTVRTSSEVTVERTMPDDVVLRSAFPNPSRSQTTIQYTLPEAEDVRLELYDVLGRHVRTLIRGRKQAGRDRVTLNVSDLANGVYFYRLSTENSMQTRKLTVVK